MAIPTVTEQQNKGLSDAELHRVARLWLNARRVELGAPPITELIGKDLIERNLPEGVMPMVVGDGPGRRLRVLHRGEQLECTIDPAVLAVADRPEILATVIADNEFGLTVGEAGIVLRIDPDGVADDAGLRVGDRIMRIAGEPVAGKSGEQIIDRLAAEHGRRFSVTVEADGDVHSVFFER